MTSSLALPYLRTSFDEQSYRKNIRTLQDYLALLAQQQVFAYSFVDSPPGGAGTRQMRRVVGDPPVAKTVRIVLPWTAAILAISAGSSANVVGNVTLKARAGGTVISGASAAVIPGGASYGYAVSNPAAVSLAAGTQLDIAATTVAGYVSTDLEAILHIVKLG